MIDDFIEKNKLESELISLPTEESMDSLIAKKRFPARMCVNIGVFNTPSNKPFMVIIPYNSELSVEKVKKIVGEDELIELDNEESIKVTGYKQGFVPPISVFGITILIDFSFENKLHLFCRVGQKNYLKAFVKEVIEFNEDVQFHCISKANC
jgi:prolyl-tRNA editing enzyme YbaK/EbsC (Cys-tRNA(Pro) deacylase)